MRYAIVDGTRSPALPKLRGICPSCGEEAIAKCGRHVVWYWAHKSKVECDPWWENETEWHRNWKDRFPAEWQEYVCQDPSTNERHIADVRTPKGLVLEFQHSLIDPAEVLSREAFYGNMIWVIDGCRNELDAPVFRLGVKNPTEPGTNVCAFTWYGRSRLFANWATSSKTVYFDFGENNMLWKLKEFDIPSKKGAVIPCSREALVALWAEA